MAAAFRSHASGLPGPDQGGGSMVGNEVFVLDRVRIEVALEARSRYKYVNPRVEREGLGWKISSPNCSRNVDPDGGEIEIAWLVPTRVPTQVPTHAPEGQGEPGQASGWLLHARDHRHGCWLLKLSAASLDEALHRLVEDEHREFWL